MLLFLLLLPFVIICLIEIMENNMPISKVNHHDEATQPKLFTGGKPKDFEITTRNSARISGKLSSSGKAYAVYVGPEVNERSDSKHELDSAALREVAEHFAELADILDGKKKAA